MNLAARLNKALIKHKLVEQRQPPSPPIIEQQTPIEHIPATLSEAMVDIDKCESDEYGIRILLVKQPDSQLRLPKAIGNWVIEDIQKRQDGIYEVHISHC